MTDTAFLGISTAWIIANVWSLVIALAFLVGGWIIANFVSRYTQAIIQSRMKNDATVAPLIGQAVRYAILFVTIIVVLGQFGVETASILAVLGAAGLAIALALQGTLANIAAGIMLVFLRPFSVGDYIDADGIVGTVVEVGLFATQLRTIDGVFLFAPNSKLSNAKITNYSREKGRIVEVKFDVPRSANLNEVREIVGNAAKTEFTDPTSKPEVLIDTLGSSSVTMIVRVPVRSREWWQARSLVQERLMAAIDRANGFAPATSA